MNPQTGEYTDAAVTSKEDDYELEDDSDKFETDKDVLKQFAKNIGLDDEDDINSLFSKMRCVLLILHAFVFIGRI